MRVNHYVNEMDNWYSCPKSGQCINDDEDGNFCNCGSDKINAEFDRLEKEISILREALENAKRIMEWALQYPNSIKTDVAMQEFLREQALQRAGGER